MTPADIPSLVEALRQLARRQRQYGATNDEKIDKTCSLTVGNLDEAAEALSPKEAELVKPPREYEVSGDAVGGIRAGMVPYGPDHPDYPNAPSDWAGDEIATRGKVAVGPTWRFHDGSNADIIAYTPEAPTASHDAARERIARIISPEGWAKIDAGARGPWVDGVRADTLKQADAILAALPTTDGAEPFGYWIEQKHAEPVLLRKPAYIPEPSDLRTVTPLYATPPTTDASEHMRETFNEGLWTGWRAGLAGEQMNDDYASTSWDVSDAAAQLDTASERMREAGQ